MSPKRGPNDEKNDAKIVLMFNIDLLRFGHQFWSLLGLQVGVKLAILASLGPSRGHIGVHFRLWWPFWVHLWLPFGLRAQFGLDFRSNLDSQNLQTSNEGTAECVERSAAPPQVRPCAGLPIKVLAKYLQAQGAQLQKPRPRSPDYPLSISPPGCAHSAGPAPRSSPYRFC